MQLSSPHPALVSSSALASAAAPIPSDAGSPSARRALDADTASRSSPPVPSAPVAPSAPENEARDVVSISAAVRAQSANPPPSMVYAEIWRGGIKVAQVDIHGQVVSYSGQVAADGGVGMAGALLAAQRAIQIARQTGGEIRTAGQPVDGQTLLMRARLEKAYVA